MAMTFWQRMTAPTVSAAVAENLEQSGVSLSVLGDRNKQNRLATDLMAKPVPSDVACPQAQPMQPSEYADVLDEYEGLAKSIGFNPPILHRERIRSMLASMGLFIYERSKVEEFLTSKFGKEKRTGIGTSATWCWRPMRAADVGVTHDDDDGTEASGYVVVSNGVSYATTRASYDILAVNGMVALSDGTYNKPVPMPVLRTVQRVLELEPKARFFISDETSLAERFRDPFLAVLLPTGDELHVIERWDEPSFRG